MITPRPYQEEIIGKVLESDNRKMLVSLPTGTGKTIVFSEIAKRSQKPTLILAHRDELIQQALEKLLMVHPEANIGIVKAEQNDVYNDITIASVQTLARRNRLTQLRPDFGLIITDEAHHAAANSYRRIYHRYGLLHGSPDEEPLPVMDRDAIHLGVTATPMRNDKMGLGSIYDQIVYEGKFQDFVEQGYLCDLHFEGVVSTLDLEGVKSTKLGGYGTDFKSNQLSDRVNTDEMHHSILSTYQKYASDRKHTLAFCVDRDHADALCTSFREAGIPSAYLDGETPLDERRGIYDSLRNQEIKIIFNIMVLTEGFDFPELDCILLARPSKSPTLLTQMIGRGTRPSPGKENCLILDVAHSHRVETNANGEVVHAGSLLELASLFYPPIEELAADKPEKEGVEEEELVEEEIGKAESEKSGPSEYFLGSASSEKSIMGYLKRNYKPHAYWHGSPATENQMKYINRMLPDINKPLTRGEASTLLDHLFSKNKKGKKKKNPQLPDIAPSNQKNLKPENTCPQCKKWKQPKYDQCYNCHQETRKAEQEAQATHFSPDTQDVIPF